MSFRWTPSAGDPPGKVLLIQLRRIGDSVLIAPSLDALRAAWPETELHLLTESPVPELFLEDPRIDVVWVRPARSRLPRLTADLRRERYDLVFDFQSLPVTALVARTTGAVSVGFRKRWRSILYHHPVNLKDHAGSEYAADHKLDLLRAVGLRPADTVPRLVRREPEEDHWGGLPAGPRVALVPVSPWAHKRWPAEAFAETARLLHRETGARFVLAGGPGERGSLEDVAAGMEGTPYRVHEFAALREFAAFLGTADLYLGNDNGPRHVALALGVPSLAWFGEHNPTHWTPPGRGPHAVLWDRRRARGGVVRDDLEIVDDQPEPAARAAVRLLAASSSR